MDGISPVCSLTIEPTLLRVTILAAVNFGQEIYDMLAETVMFRSSHAENL